MKKEAIMTIDYLDTDSATYLKTDVWAKTAIVKKIMMGVIVN